MGHGVAELVVQWVVVTTLTFFFVVDDERHLDEERLERAWIPASRTVALVYFGILAVPFHFIKTRGHFRSLRGFAGLFLGLLRGALAVLEIAVVAELLMGAIFRALGWPTEMGP